MIVYHCLKCHEDIEVDDNEILLCCKNCGDKLTPDAILARHFRGTEGEKKQMNIYPCQKCNKQMRECPDGSGLFCEDCMIFRDFKHFEKGVRMKRYAAFESMTGDSKFFDTIEDAKQWLIEMWQQGATDLEVEGGFIAEVLYHGRTENKLVKYEGDGE